MSTYSEPPYTKLPKREWATAWVRSPLTDSAGLKTHVIEGPRGLMPDTPDPIFLVNNWFRIVPPRGPTIYFYGEAAHEDVVLVANNLERGFTL